MIDTLSFVILALATYRISHLVAEEDGPGDVCKHLKEGAGAVWHPELGYWVATGFWGKLVTCPLCLSIWVSVVLYLTVSLAPALWPVIVVLAASGASVAIEIRGR